VPGRLPDPNFSRSGSGYATGATFRSRAPHAITARSASMIASRFSGGQGYFRSPRRCGARRTGIPSCSFTSAIHDALGTNPACRRTRNLTSSLNDIPPLTFADYSNPRNALNQSIALVSHHRPAVVFRVFHRSSTGRIHHDCSGIPVERAGVREGVARGGRAALEQPFTACRACYCQRSFRSSPPGRTSTPHTARSGWKAREPPPA
jgi:hypothetical protein